MRDRDDTENIGQAAGAIVAIGVLPDGARDLLVGYVAGPSSDVAAAATGVLAKLAPASVVELDPALRIRRAAAELASSDPGVRRSALREIDRLGQAAASLIPILHELGTRAASEDATGSELSAVRKTLTKLGVAADDLPRPPSRLPSGERAASLAIPEQLTSGWPVRLVVSGDRATVYCGDEDTPYEFEIDLATATVPTSK